VAFSSAWARMVCCSAVTWGKVRPLW
jgi:hypothetical protein